MFRFQGDRHIILGVRISLELSPCLNSLFEEVPFGASGRPLMYAIVLSSGATMPARAPPSIDMLQRVIRPSMLSASNGGAGIFDDIAGSSGRADLPNDRKNNILGRAAVGKRPIDAYFHGLGPLLHQTLRGQHVLYFTGPDTERQGTKRPMGGRMGVATDNSCTGEGESLFRPDDMHDTLADVAHVEKGDAEILAVVFECLNLKSTHCDRRSPAAGLWWGHYGPARRVLRPVVVADVPQALTLRRPGGMSLHEPIVDRYTAASFRPVPFGRHANPKFCRTTSCPPSALLLR